MEYYLAIDIGASSGRHILAHMENGKLVLEEIYRFKNMMLKKGDKKIWDIDYLTEQVKHGIRECKRKNKIPKSIGIDTWAVDYVLLDEKKQLMYDVYAYRDTRTEKRISEVNKQYSQKDLFQLTGIQFQPFNTIYQLASEEEEKLEKASYFLMIPDYLHYILTGELTNEYTNLTTTQLMEYQTDKISGNIIKSLGINKTIFPKLVRAGERIGRFTDSIKEELGFDCEVIAPATHDTGSAYMATVEEDAIILSSGTWSLLGIEVDEPIITEAAMEYNFTNEGGFNKKYRFLKNIMGLWIIQEVARLLEKKYEFSELVLLAREAPFEEVFDVNHPRFLNPQHMIVEIKNDFLEKGKIPPATTGELAYCVFNSLAHSYRKAISELEMIVNKKYRIINIIGGGCQNELLNELIAKICNKTVVAGPVEATALGNLLAQMIQQEVIFDISAGRKIIRNSFKIKHYEG